MNVLSLSPCPVFMLIIIFQSISKQAVLNVLGKSPYAFIFRGKYIYFLDPNLLYKLRWSLIHSQYV